MRILALLLVVSCPGWDMTPAAQTRQMAEGRLAVCIADTNCGQTSVCYPPVWAFCLDAGLERTCGEGFQGATPCGH